MCAVRTSSLGALPGQEPRTFGSGVISALKKSAYSPYARRIYLYRIIIQLYQIPYAHFARLPDSRYSGTVDIALWRRNQARRARVRVMSW